MGGIAGDPWKPKGADGELCLAVRSRQPFGRTWYGMPKLDAVFYFRIFQVSILIFNRAVMPFLQFFMDWVFSHTPGTSSSVWAWFGPLLTCIFSTLWILPIFLLSKIVNCLWFQVCLWQHANRHFVNPIPDGKVNFIFVSGYCRFGVQELEGPAKGFSEHQQLHR